MKTTSSSRGELNLRLMVRELIPESATCCARCGDLFEKASA
jgi:hypothetical protein